MTRKTRDEATYWALVKFEVHADHFSPAYSFAHFRGKSKIDVSEEITENFLSKLDQAISFEEANEETETDRAELENRLRSITSTYLNENPLALGQLKKLESSFTIGYPSYDLKIVADGPWSQFAEAFLPALEEDEDFRYFVDEYASKDDSDKTPEQTELFIQYQKLKQIRSAKHKKQDVSEFLNLVVEVVMNEVM